MSKMVRKIVIFSEMPSASRSLNLVCVPPTEFSSLENDINLFVCGSSYGENIDFSSMCGFEFIRYFYYLTLYIILLRASYDRNLIAFT